MKICWYQTQRLMKVLPDYIHFTVLRFSPDGVLEDAFRVYDIPLPRRLANASDQRRAEYLAGRIGAQKLLQHFDSSLCAPLMADDRAPSWPSSFCGAISHDRDFASAAVIKMHHGRVGIDIESLSPKIALDTISQRIASAGKLTHWPTPAICFRTTSCHCFFLLKRVPIRLSHVIFNSIWTFTVLNCARLIPTCSSLLLA